jgi:hypothetical protein
MPFYALLQLHASLHEKKMASLQAPLFIIEVELESVLLPDSGSQVLDMQLHLRNAAVIAARRPVVDLYPR